MEVQGEAGAIKAFWFPQGPDNPPLLSLQRWQDLNSTQWHMPGCFFTIFPGFCGPCLSLSSSQSRKGEHLYSSLHQTSGKVAPSFLVFKFPAASLHKASVVLSWVCCFSLCKLLEHQLLPPFSDYI